MQERETRQSFQVEEHAYVRVGPVCVVYKVLCINTMNGSYLYSPGRTEILSDDTS